MFEKDCCPIPFEAADLRDNWLRRKTKRHPLVSLSHNSHALSNAFLIGPNKHLANRPERTNGD